MRNLVSIFKEMTTTNKMLAVWTGMDVASLHDVIRGDEVYELEDLSLELVRYSPSNFNLRRCTNAYNQCNDVE